MRTIVSALTWEFFSHQIRIMILCVLFANAFPIWIIFALQGYGVDLDSTEMAILPTALIPFAIFLLGFATSIGQGSINRLYLRPLTNMQLVHSFFFPALAITAVMLAGSIAAWNLLFKLHWPILGPVLFSTVFWAAMFPSLRLVTQSPTRVFETIAVTLLFMAWYARSNFGNQPNKSLLQNHITISDYVIVLGVILGSFMLCVWRVSADRCNRTESKLMAFVNGIINSRDQRKSSSSAPFAHKFQAQNWYDWKTCGLPFIIVFALLLALPIPVLLFAVTLGNESLSSALTSNRTMLLTLGIVHCVSAWLWGFLAQHLRIGAHDISEHSELAKESQLGVNLGMGSFQATLPICDRSLATSLLRTMLLVSVLGAIVFVSVWVIQSALSWSCSAPIFVENRRIGPAVLLLGFAVSPWTLMSLSCCLSLLSSRSRWRAVATFLGMLATILLVSWIHAAAAMTILAVVVAVFVATCFRNRSTPVMIGASLAVALAIFLVAFYLTPNQQPHREIILIYSVALGLAAVLPIHLMPLAIAAYRRS